MRNQKSAVDSRAMGPLRPFGPNGSVASHAELHKPGTRPVLAGEEAPTPEGRLSAIRSTILKALEADDFASLRLLLPQYAKDLEMALRSATLGAAKLQHMETEHSRFYEQLRASLLTNRIRVRLELERVRAARRYEGELEDVPMLTLHG